MHLKCYYIPMVNTRIASVQEILKNHPDKRINMDQQELKLYGSEVNPKLTIPYCVVSNLPEANLVNTAKVL